MESYISQTTKEKTNQDISEFLPSDETSHNNPSTLSENKRKSKLSKPTNVPHGNEGKGVQLSEEETKLQIVNEISQEIVNTALDLIYENYLEKQTVYFVSHCARLAWKALVELNFQKKDRGGFVEAERDQLDAEPLPSPKDSWAGHSVPIGPGLPKHSNVKSKESQTTELSPKFSDISTNISTKPTVSQMELDPSVSKGRILKQKKKIDKIASSARKSDEYVVRLDAKIANKADDLRKDSYELPSPVALQAKHFPSARVEVQYAITPGNPSKGATLASKNELKTKTIVLKKNSEKEKSKPKDD